MQLVIDISEEMYNFACNYPEKVLAGYSLCIKRGTPLPKGHGRLIDEDVLLRNAKSVQTVIDVNNAPTIIEAVTGGK